ncbi:MAG: YciI family protein [Fimbriimonadaceae bacterium]|nr:YciI family protein [Alphaproteobacteria bacterium]
MKYIALIYAAEGSGPQPGTAEFTEMMNGYFKANETYAKDGVFVAGEPLEATATATTLRIRKGKTETMDGPFVETKEALGGFYIFDCENLDEALRYAAMIPSAHFGSIEVRPIMVLEGRP